MRHTNIPAYAPLLPANDDGIQGADIRPLTNYDMLMVFHDNPVELLPVIFADSLEDAGILLRIYVHRSLKVMRYIVWRGTTVRRAIIDDLDETELKRVINRITDKTLACGTRGYRLRRAILATMNAHLKGRSGPTPLRGGFV